MITVESLIPRGINQSQGDGIKMIIQYEKNKITKAKGRENLGPSININDLASNPVNI